MDKYLNLTDLEELEPEELLIFGESPEVIETELDFLFGDYNSFEVVGYNK